MFSKFETLESRRLMSGATLVDGVLRVRGDDVTNEDLVVKLVDGGANILVTIDGVEAGTFLAADVTKISMNGKSGRDDLIIDESGGRFKPFKVELRGGAGNDVIIGGRDKIKALGEDGSDTITGRGYLDGGLGNDTINGSIGKDYIFGGEGNDFVDGEEGNDVIWGGAGNDRLEGDEGNDMVFGEDGADTLTGGDGNDRLYGNTGIDRIDGEAGDDTMFGGRSDDVLIGGTGTDEKNFGEFAGIEELMAAQLAKAKASV